MATGNNWESDDDDDPNDEGQQQAKPKGGGLRAHAEQVKRENDELKAKLDKLEKAERTRNIETAIKAKGFDPRVAGLVPENVASDTTELDKWLNDNAQLFKPAAKQEDEAAPAEEVEELDELSDDVDAWGRMSRVSSSSLPPTKQADTLAAIKNAKDRKELDEILKKFGNTNV